MINIPLKNRHFELFLATPWTLFAYLVSTNRSARRNRFEMDPHVLIFPPLTTQEE